MNDSKVTVPWLAPKPKPMPIARNKYDSSSGSLIAARNLIIESAPTSPNDNANEDFTMEMMSIVVIVMSKKLRPNIFLFDKVLP